LKQAENGSRRALLRRESAYLQCASLALESDLIYFSRLEYCSEFLKFWKNGFIFLLIFKFGYLIG
jgi:hypothetical protein